MSDSEKSFKKAEVLLGFLRTDPYNTQLKLDAAEASLAAGLNAKVIELLIDFSSEDELLIPAQNLIGMAALSEQKFEMAAQSFQAMVDRGVTDENIGFNLSFALTHLGRYAEALEILPDRAVQNLAQAAMLKVQLLHQVGEFDDAEETARQAVVSFPEHIGLMAATSVLALDIEDRNLARQAAEIARDHPDGKTTLATLALEDADTETAFSLFNEVVVSNPMKPRSWIGRGLTQLMLGDYVEGAKDLDHGAKLFGDHLGSWIAAGWAYFIQRNYEESRIRFQTALDFDPSFSESHGSLAVIAVLDGDEQKARHLIRTARGLDKNCLSAAFAQSLLAGARGQADVARQITEKALNTPIDDGGRTLAEMLVKMTATSRLK